MSKLIYQNVYSYYATANTVHPWLLSHSEKHKLIYMLPMCPYLISDASPKTFGIDKDFWQKKEWLVISGLINAKV